MEQTRSYLRLGVRYPYLSRGFHWLGRLRLGSFWTAVRFARIGWLAARYRETCPMCQRVVAGRGEDVAHFLLECVCWTEWRERYLRRWTSMNGVAWFNLLGGSREDGGLSLRDVKDLWCPRDDTFHPEVDLQTGNEADGHIFPGCVNVTQYLQEVVPRRLVRLKTLLEAPRADADNNGMAALVAAGGDVDEGANDVGDGEEEVPAAEVVGAIRAVLVARAEVDVDSPVVAGTRRGLVGVVLDGGAG